MKKIKKKLLTALLYTICWRNVDKSYDFWIYAEYDLLEKRSEKNVFKNNN